MNVRLPIESSSPTAVLFVAFNKDASCFSVGLESGICGMPWEHVGRDSQQPANRDLVFQTKSCQLKGSRG